MYMDGEEEVHVVELRSGSYNTPVQPGEDGGL